MAQLSQNQYVLIDMGAWRMALPQSDVVSVELLSDAICTRKGRRLVWWIKWRETRMEILALDAEANSADVEDVDGNVLVLLGEGKTPSLGLACANIEVIDASDVSNEVILPTVMAKALNLFSHLAMHRGELLCISELTKLEVYLQQAAN